MSNNYTKEDIERMRREMEGETALDKIKRKMKEEPLVPAGNVIKYLIFDRVQNPLENLRFLFSN